MLCNSGTVNANTAEQLKNMRIVEKNSRTKREKGNNYPIQEKRSV